MIVTHLTKKRNALFYLLTWALLAHPLRANENLASQQPWYYRAFGQSVDIFFANSANAPGQDGINHAWINPSWPYQDALYVQSLDDLNSALQPNMPVMLKPSDIIVIESRGGKIAAGHDGMTFFYTPLSATRNFLVEATLTLTAAGPHPNNIGSRGKLVSAFQQQSGGGLLVRDVIAPHRNDPAIEGLEELPAVSNFSAAGFLGGRILADRRIVYGGTLYRDGQTSLLGNVGVGRKGKPEAHLQVGVAYRYQLERTNDGYFVTISQLDGEVVVPRSWAGAHDLANRVNTEQLFVGIGAMREGRLVVEHLTITDKGINTAEPTLAPRVSSEPTLLIKSHHFSTQNQYTLALFANKTGFVELKLGDQQLKRLQISANEEEYYPINLSPGENQLHLSLHYDNEQSLNLSYSVTYDPQRQHLSSLYAAPQANGIGTQEDPANLDQALKWLEPGQTLYLMDGHYTSPILIDSTNGGLPNQPKTIRPLNKGKVWLNTHVVIQGNYWHLQELLIGGTSDQRISVTGGGTLGDAVVNILGNYNILEQVIAEYGTGTGINIGNSGIFKEFFPKYNRIINCEARYNADAAGNNADGFGAKRVGPGNYFYGSIAHHNIDDGWDLFNPIDAGPSDSVIIEACIAYNNARNGFKLGGEGLPAPHIIRNCLSFENGMAGFSDNFNPGAITIVQSTAVNNGDQNFLLRDNPIFRPQNSVMNSISWRCDLSTGKNDYISGKAKRVWLLQRQRFSPSAYQPTKNDFISVIPPAYYARDAQGEIIWTEYMRLAPGSPLRRLGLGRTALGPAQLSS